MKNQRSLLVLAAALAAVSFSLVASAQPAGRPERGERPLRAAQGERGEKMREHMAKELGLTADQQTRIDAIQAQAREQRQAVMAEAQGNREQAREKMQAINKSTQQQVDAVLTPEQRVKAQEMRAKGRERAEQVKERAKERRDRRMGDGPKN